jgi:hypothetical protein
MKPVLAVASFFAIGLTLVSGGASKPCIPHFLCIILIIPRTATVRSPGALSISCGDGSQILERGFVEHNGNRIWFMSATCPQSDNSANNTKRAAIDERQFICTDGDCEGCLVLPLQEFLDQ